MESDMPLTCLNLPLDYAGVSNQPQPTGHMRPRMAMNAAQHKFVNLLKTFSFCSAVFISVCVFNVWPRDTKRLDTPASLRGQ